MTLLWQSTSRSHRGKVRQLNEDCVYTHPQGMLWSVADGMGGHEAGDTASAIVVEELAKVAPDEEIDGLLESCKHRLRQASARIKRYSKERCGGRSVGSTVACLLAAKDGASFVWAGDSRLYRLRGAKLERLSTDHSEVAQLVALGHLTEAEARVHPKSNIITRTIGVGGVQGAESITVDARAEDLFLICSDGLYNELEESDILDCLNEEELESIADALIARTLATPAKDNVSLIVLRCSNN